MKKLFSFVIIAAIVIGCKKDKVDPVADPKKDEAASISQLIMFKITNQQFESAFQFSFPPIELIYDSIPIVGIHYYAGTIAKNTWRLTTNDTLLYQIDNQINYVGEEIPESFYEVDTTTIQPIESQTFQLIGNISQQEIEFCYNSIASRKIFNQYRTAFPNSKIAIISFINYEFDEIAGENIPVKKYYVCLVK